MSNSAFAPMIFSKKALATLVLVLPFFAALLFAQPPGASGRMGAAMNNGRFYGKVVDERGKGVGYATVSLFGMKFDTLTRTPKETLLAGQITEDNGDFALENLPVMGDFTLKISFLGYAEVTKKVTFGIQMPAGGGRPGGTTPPGTTPNPNRNMSDLASKLDVDLGNISIAESATTLQTVTVTAEATNVTLALDKKIYRVDKDASAAGGTAEDALKNVPSLAVDIDGNLTLRNAAPQLFIDGRPTTLSLDQIAADAIETVEVITNPSAKYDASGGQAGIVNITLKKDRRIGYNGNIRLGMDSRGAANLNGDVNARDGKFNAFLGGNLNQRKSKSDAETDRLNFLSGTPFTQILQTTDSQNDGFFANGRAGLDWFMDNRNTLTFTGNYTRGKFESEDLIDIRTDSLLSNTFTNSLRNSNSERNFRRLGGALLFKHLFPKTGKELTADLNFDQHKSNGNGDFTTNYSSLNTISRERQESDGNSQSMTFQMDYVEPITDRIKVEAGARASIRQQENNSFNERSDDEGQTWISQPTFGDRYNYDDKVYAVYGSFSHQFPKWGYQIGLRAESSQYEGRLPDVDSTFTNDYPLSLFPSVFFTRKLNEEDNVQLSYTRRIQRPNFFQLMPFTDFSDSLNLQRGNPDLRPEFTNSLELSYQNIFKQGNNLLISAYYKKATDLITRYQFEETDLNLERQVIVSSYLNANSSEAYGVEVTLRNTFVKIIELTSNVNLYNSKVDASNVESSLVNEQFSWFIKENLSVRLPASFTFQVTGEYRSRAAYSPSSGGGGGGGRFGGGGGGGWMGGPTNTAQGYSLANWFMDVSLRKDLLKRKASLTINVQDIWRSRKNGTHTESEFFVQDTWRVRDPQVVRVNFSYRFGKMDASLFKRKNTKQSSEGMEMMGN